MVDENLKPVDTGTYIENQVSSLYETLGQPKPYVEFYSGPDIDNLAIANQFNPFRILNDPRITSYDGFRVAGIMGEEISRYFPKTEEQLPVKIIFGLDPQFFTGVPYEPEDILKIGGWHLSFILAALKLHLNLDRKKELEEWNSWVTDTIGDEVRIFDILLSLPPTVIEWLTLSGLLEAVGNPTIKIPAVFISCIVSGALTYRGISLLHQLKIDRFLLQHPVAVRGKDIFYEQNVRLPIPEQLCGEHTEE